MAEAVETVKINVGGTVFTTALSTLSRHTGTFLARLVDDTNSIAKRDSDGNRFVDRDPAAFGVLLNFLRGGSIHVPREMSHLRLKQELDFWGFDLDVIEAKKIVFNDLGSRLRELNAPAVAGRVEKFVKIFFENFCLETVAGLGRDHVNVAMDIRPRIPPKKCNSECEACQAGWHLTLSEVKTCFPMSNFYKEWWEAVSKQGRPRSSKKNSSGCPELSCDEITKFFNRYDRMTSGHDLDYREEAVLKELVASQRRLLKKHYPSAFNVFNNQTARDLWDKRMQGRGLRTKWTRSSITVGKKSVVSKAGPCHGLYKGSKGGYRNKVYPGTWICTVEWGEKAEPRPAKRARK